MSRAPLFGAACAVFMFAFVAPASAHGPPPQAVELLTRSEDDAAFVRLSPGGLAHRVSDGFRYVCPESWGGDVLAPTAAVPFGSVLVASDSLFVIGADGQLALHSVQSGAGIAITSQRDAAFALFEHDGQHQLRRVTASSNELVRALPEPFMALAATDSDVALLRWTDRTLVVERMSLAGEALGAITWTSPSPVAYARLRVAAGQLYALVWGRSAPWVSLGRVADGGYQVLREASTDISGPAALGSGTFVVLDGALHPLDTEVGLDASGTRLTCLGEGDGEPYACAHGDLLRITERGLGAPLFTLTSLREPDYAGLDAGGRADCRVRWLDLQRDALAATTGSDASQATSRDGGAEGDASTRDVTGPKPGCSLRAHGGPPSTCWLLVTCVAGLLRRRRRAQSPILSSTSANGGVPRRPGEGCVRRAAAGSRPYA